MVNLASLSRREVLKLGVMLGLTGCAPGAVKQSEAADRFSFTLSSPEDAGFSSAKLEAVRTAIQKHIDANQISGAVTAIARHNKLVWYEAQGFRNPETGDPMRKDDIFRMMSSTKPVTATAVLMMMEEGRLSPGDKVGRFIPAFRDQKVAIAPASQGRPVVANHEVTVQDLATHAGVDPSKVTLVPADRDITIQDLLTHTSGLSSFGNGLTMGPASLVNKIEFKPDDTLADYVPRLGAAALDFQPGSKWRYSPKDGFDVLLRIVEITSGQPADVLLRERVFEPLDMRDTYFSVPVEKKERVLALYAQKDGTWKPQPSMFGDGPFKYFSGAGGLFSTVHDYLQFELMLLNHGTLNGRRLLKPETVALMAQNHVGTMFAEWIPPVTAGMGFGLGVGVVEDPSKTHGRGRGAFGWGGAYGTESWADPEIDVAACMFIQQPVGDVKNDFQTALRQAIVS